MKPVGAPACFAAASVFSRDSDICKACVAFGECTTASLETLQAIRGIINVDDLMKRHAAARKVAEVRIAAADAATDALTPPGNGEKPLIVKPVERKTKVVAIKFEASPDEDQLLIKMPVKARDIALRMVKSNDVEGVRLALSKKRNYYAEKGPGFLRVGMGLLLAGGFTKRSLRIALETELGWTEGSAASHVGMICVIVLAFKYAQEIKGEFTLTPELSA